MKDKQAEAYLEKLISYVEEKKPYLDRDLSIQDLSDTTGIPRHHITQVLNEKHKKNFFTFINEYRVKEVIARFSDPKNNNFTILAIAYDSGFNSKTTFNSIFKSQTGMTPSEFREKSRNQGDRRQLEEPILVLSSSPSGTNQLILHFTGTGKSDKTTGL